MTSAATWGNAIAQGNALIFTHMSQHARLEIPMDLRDAIAFSPSRPASATL